MGSKNMREEMPTVAAWIDDLRKGFGDAAINKQIARAMKGEPVFFASENGHQVGTPVPTGVRVGKDARGNACLLDGPQGPQEPEISKYEARMRREKREEGK